MITEFLIEFYSIQMKLSTVQWVSHDHKLFLVNAIFRVSNYNHLFRAFLWDCTQKLLSQLNVGDLSKSKFSAASMLPLPIMQK